MLHFLVRLVYNDIIVAIACVINAFRIVPLEGARLGLGRATVAL